MRKTSLLTSCSGLAWALGGMMAASGAAGAADAGSASGQSGSAVLDEIVVTAQFRSQNVQDTPIAISALNGDMLAERGMADVAGAASLAPNVQLSRGAGSFGQMASIFVRGVGQADPHFAVEPGVGMYVDDVYYGVLTGSIFQLLDTDRVEVLRGPQGTLAGKNSIGGAIKLFSKRPGPDADAYAEASFGSFDRVGGRAASSFTIAEDSLYGRFSVAGRRRDGYVDRLDYACVTGNTETGSNRLRRDCKIGTQGAERVWTARGSLRWIASDAIENTIIFDITQDDSETPASKLRLQSPLWTGGADYITGPKSYTNYEDYVSTPTGPGAPSSYVMPDDTPLDAWGISNLLDVEFSDTLRLRSITGFRSSVVRFSNTVDAGPVSVLNQLWRLDHEQFTQELRLSGEFGTLVEWTVGGFYYDADGVSEGRVTIPGGVVVGGGGVNLDTVFQDPVTTRSKSVFAHAILHPTEALSLTAAVRYTDDLKRFTFNRYDHTGAPHPVLGGLLDLTNEFSGDRVDYRFAVDYRWSDAVMTYAQIATGFKGGGINPRPFFPSQVVPYEPETLTAYEVGVKSELLGRRLRLNAAAFYNEYRNFQATLLQCDSISPFPGAPCTQTTNVGDADIKGVEVEAELRPVEGLSINASAGLLDFEYQEVNPLTGIGLDMTNVYTPDVTVAAGIQYEIPLGDRGTLTPRLDYSYRSEIYGDPVNSPINRIAGRGLFDAQITWTNGDGDWQAILQVKNLTDKFYYESNYFREAAPYFAGTGRPGWPREWVVTVKRSF